LLDSVPDKVIMCMYTSCFYIYCSITIIGCSWVIMVTYFVYSKR